MLNVYVSFGCDQLSDRCPGWIPRSACRGHSLTASGQPSSRVITKEQVYFPHTCASRPSKRSRAPADLPQSSHTAGTKPAHHICMWLSERSGTDYARCGQLPLCNKPHKPQSQTGGAASASRQFAAVTSAAWREAARRADAVVRARLLRALRDISHLSIGI